MDHILAGRLFLYCKAHIQGNINFALPTIHRFYTSNVHYAIQNSDPHMKPTFLFPSEWALKFAHGFPGPFLQTTRTIKTLHSNEHGTIG